MRTSYSLVEDLKTYDEPYEVGKWLTTDPPVLQPNVEMFSECSYSEGTPPPFYSDESSWEELSEEAFEEETDDDEPLLDGDELDEDVLNSENCPHS